MPPCATLSGGDQYVILPAVEGQDLIVSAGGRLLIRLQDGGTALSGDLVNAQSAVGCGIVAHGGSGVN